jgi:L-malate glycosyltransferase
MARPHEFIGHFDIFALSSDSEQFPISLLEAMAAGRPCVSTDVGDVATMVSAPNRRFVVVPDAFDDALAQMCASDTLRHTIGAANHARATADYDERHMIAHYQALYKSALRDC